MASLRQLTILCGMSVLLVFSAAADASEEAVELHCTGKSWRVIGTSEEVSTDALVRIDSRGTYIAVSGVGAGQSNSRPRPASNVENVGSIDLQSAAEGRPAIPAWFNINRYNGELLVASKAPNEKFLFFGNCRRSNPLF